MKKNILILLSLMVSAQAFSQDLNWHMGGSYGANIEEAQKFVKRKKAAKEAVIVAIIDSGIDINHAALKENIWTNKKEIAGNGIDDDNNGYIDDVNGWNFVPWDGEKRMNGLLETDREFLRLYPKYGKLTKEQITATDVDEYNYFKSLISGSSVARNYTKGVYFESLGETLDTLKGCLQKDLNKEVIEKEDLIALKKYLPTLSSLKVSLLQVYVMSWNTKHATFNWDQMREQWVKYTDRAFAEFDVDMKKYENFVSDRLLLGDNINDINDRKYGSPKVVTGAEHGTHVAGIVAAKRNKNDGMCGVIENVKIMPLVVTMEGDEYDKDVALAIRYAVDNGASIINMSFFKSISTKKEWVDDAIAYAEEKGVLLVHCAGNDSKNLDQTPNYPNGNLKNGKTVNNFINVGSSNFEGVPAKSSCYGKTNVTVFAPGESIYSTVLNDNYKKHSGTSMAAPVVSGIAAIIKTYYPDLSAAQIKEIIVATAKKAPADTKLNDMSVSGGIVDAYEAVVMADKISKTK